MALPVAPAPKPNDVAVLGWCWLTVRVAWTLVSNGVRVRPEVLRDARSHVLFQLEPTAVLPQAEDLATRWVEAYILRARGQLASDPWPADWEMPLSPRWRAAVCGTGDASASVDELAPVVLRKHYGDYRSLDWLSKHLVVDRRRLEAVQGGLREAVRRIAQADGLPLDGWDSDRIDRLLRRIAAWAPPGCPSPLDVAEGCHREHVSDCPRCDRLFRLLKAEVIGLDDLMPPTVGARPSGRARVLALQLHPDGRRARRRLIEEIPTPVYVHGEDLMLLDAAEIDAVVRILRIAAEVGAPVREHLRGALLDGLGAWTPRGLIGPLPERVAREVLQRSWGTVDGLGTLPDLLPEPPSARGWWLGALAMGTGAVFATLLAAMPPTSAVDDGVEAAFTPGRGGTWVAFDVPDRAVVTMIGELEGELFPVLASATAADKAVFAVGDGTYRVHVAADAVLFAAGDEPVPEVAARIREAGGLEELARTLPGGASVRLYRR
jgi:hypothetical protein